MKNNFKNGDKVKLKEFRIGNNCFADGGVGTFIGFKNKNALIQREDNTKTYYPIEYIELLH